MGNRGYPALNSDGKDDGVHVMVYRADDIERDPACKLTRGGMILIALLSGGDYDQVSVNYPCVLYDLITHIVGPILIGS